MGKFSVSAALAVSLVLFLAISHATNARRHTTITTVEFEEEATLGGPEQGCREQIQRQDLEHCEQYLASRRDRRAGSGEGYDEGAVARHEMRSCCHQLKQVDQQCRCQEIRQIVREQQQEYAGHEMEEIVRAARELPSMCEMSPRRCEIRTVWF
ncbi:hypothetical protein MLD38_034224 [Melastoma candidum]|uniref:Uncharacterized protein n=1 Tax=Melastoma candidum TaxID=119954 RepID=A0ACB9MBK7_9MYRT|nr:hypothetical protein MLD38_034224 [Melastoma candidum]